MGKSQSSVAPFIPFDYYSYNSLLTQNTLRGIHKQAIYEYPFLKNEWCSMVITDAYDPENIIVYASDIFETITEYKKCDIIGKNCRFLQGVMTDPGTIEVIREAIRNGVPCDVEILNYTKTEIPFWNNLILLPLHRQGKKSGKVRYFIGIQQEISYLKYSPNPLEWTAPEVATWLGKVDIGYLHQYTKEIVSQEIDGQKLLTMNVNDCHWIEPPHREKLVKMIQQLKDNPTEYFKAEKKSLENSKIELKRYNKDIEYLYKISVEKQWKKSKKISKPNSSLLSTITLTNIDTFPEEKKKFLKYLTSIYCVHFYEFVEHVNAMKKSEIYDDSVAWGIYQKFFIENDFRILLKNVGHTTLYSVGNMLDIAYLEVLGLVQEYFNAWQLERKKEIQI